MPFRARRFDRGRVTSRPRRRAHLSIGWIIELSSRATDAIGRAPVLHGQAVSLGERARRSRISSKGDRVMKRLWISPTANGKARILLGAAAVRESRRMANEIDRAIGRALRGDMADSEIGKLERLASMVENIARGTG